jgi:hypothetical protein
MPKPKPLTILSLAAVILSFKPCPSRPQIRISQFLKPPSAEDGLRDRDPFEDFGPFDFDIPDREVRFRRDRLHGFGLAVDEDFQPLHGVGLADYFATVAVAIANEAHPLEIQHITGGVEVESISEVN